MSSSRSTNVSPLCSHDTQPEGQPTSHVRVRPSSSACRGGCTRIRGGPADRDASRCPGSGVRSLPAFRSFRRRTRCARRRGVYLVVDPQHVIAFGAKLVVLRGEVHLLPMRLPNQQSAQDARYRAVAYLNPLSSDVISQDRSRPVRDRNRYIARGPTRLGFDARRIGVRERGRPSRTWGVRQTAFWVVPHPENRAFHSHAVRGLHTQGLRDGVRTRPLGHEQQR